MFSGGKGHLRGLGAPKLARLGAEDGFLAKKRGLLGEGRGFGLSSKKTPGKNLCQGATKAIGCGGGSVGSYGSAKKKPRTSKGKNTCDVGMGVLIPAEAGRAGRRVENTTLEGKGKKIESRQGFGGGGGKKHNRRPRPGKKQNHPQ